MNLEELTKWVKINNCNNYKNSINNDNTIPFRCDLIQKVLFRHIRKQGVGGKQKIK
jgi:hypothetical protein